MNKKGSVLMIALWIVVFLVMFALSLGNRVFLSLRLARYQRDSLKAVWLAKSGINRAVWELKKDAKSPDGYDGLDENWSTGLDDSGKSIFENVKLREDYEGTFNVRYLSDKTKNKYLSVEDEERKLNVNVADKKLLMELFTSAGFSSDAFELSEFILKWRGSTFTTEEIFKKEFLKVPEELLLVFEYYFYQLKNIEKKEAALKAWELFDEIKELVTVYGADKLNINTVSKENLVILANTMAKGDSVKESAVADITDKLIKLRGEKHLTKSGDVFFDGLIVKEKSLLDDLMKAVIFQSNNFKIQSAGSFANVARHIDAVYDRTADKFVYWHEK